jgi:integrase/recombinase XerD
MQKKPLKELIEDLDKELLRLGYAKGSMEFYRRHWRRVIKFAEQRKEIYYTEKLGIEYLENVYHITEKDFYRTLPKKSSMELRIIRMIGDFQLHNAVLRRYHRKKEILTDPYYMDISSDFKRHYESKGYSKVTVGHFVSQAEHFMDFLISQGINDCQNIDLSIVHSYIKTLVGFSYKTVEQNICSIRAFLRYLLEKEILKADLASKTPMVKIRKQTGIPSVWTKQELEKLITAIDRGNPKGKRDYAIILLACILGIRVGDIKKLTFDCFHWAEKKLVFIQSKTKEKVILPLPSEIGWAVIDYLKYGRPIVDSSIVFVRHLAPFSPFSEENSLSEMIRSYMKIAHIPSLKKHRGMHSLRHTAASRMLEHGTPLAVISDILGHSSTEATAVYLKVDLDKLKECCMYTAEVTDNV